MRLTVPDVPADLTALDDAKLEKLHFGIAELREELRVLQAPVVDEVQRRQTLANAALITDAEPGSVTTKGS